MNVYPRKNQQIRDKIRNEEDDKVLNNKQKHHYDLIKSKIIQDSQKHEYKDKLNSNDMQKKLNYDEIANASYTVDHTDANDTTINNNTLNNISSHSKGIEKQMNPHNIPKGFYQQTYHNERKIKHAMTLKELKNHLHINIHKPQKAERISNIKEQQYINQHSGPTLS